MKNVFATILLSICALSAGASTTNVFVAPKPPMNAKEFHMARTEHMRKCQDGMASIASGGQVCGGGVGGINPTSTIIDTRSEEEKSAPKAPGTWYQVCNGLSLTITPVYDYNPRTKRPAVESGCKMTLHSV